MANNCINAWLSKKEMKNQYVDVMKYYYLLRHKILKKKQTQTALKYYGIVAVPVMALFVLLFLKIQS